MEHYLYNGTSEFTIGRGIRANVMTFLTLHFAQRIVINGTMGLYSQDNS